VTRQHPKARIVRWAFLALFASQATACSAAFTTAKLMAAQRAVEAAGEAGAEELAPHPYARAQFHLAGAWEQSNYNAYRDAFKMAQTALAEAEAARLIAEGGDPRARALEATDELSDRQEEAYDPDALDRPPEPEPEEEVKPPEHQDEFGGEDFLDDEEEEEEEEPLWDDEEEEAP